MRVQLNDNPMARYLVRLGDDALVLGQRLTEWCSNAPTLEEDLALANTALDFLGRARFLYSAAGDLIGATEDEIAFLREGREFTNLLMVELPRGDFADTMVRQLLIDEFEQHYYQALTRSSDEQLAAIAAKAVKEIGYHVRRSKEWILRLGRGTEESHMRAQRALDAVWGYVPELFQMDALESDLSANGVAPDRSLIEPLWRRGVEEQLGRAGLEVPADTWKVDGGRRGVHTEHLGFLLAEMQYMQRAYPGLSW